MESHGYNIHLKIFPGDDVLELLYLGADVAGGEEGVSVAAADHAVAVAATQLSLQPVRLTPQPLTHDVQLLVLALQ